MLLNDFFKFFLINLSVFKLYYHDEETCTSMYLPIDMPVLPKKSLDRTKPYLDDNVGSRPKLSN